MPKCVRPLLTLSVVRISSRTKPSLEAGPASPSPGDDALRRQSAIGQLPPCPASATGPGRAGEALEAIGAAGIGFAIGGQPRCDRAGRLTPLQLSVLAAAQPMPPQMVSGMAAARKRWQRGGCAGGSAGLAEAAKGWQPEIVRRHWPYTSWATEQAT